MISLNFKLFLSIVVVIYIIGWILARREANKIIQMEQQGK